MIKIEPQGGELICPKISQLEHDRVELHVQAI